MLVVFVRTFIIYIVVVLLMRIMGKRQIGQLEPYELVVAIMIAELAAIPMEDKAIPLINGLAPIFTLFFIQVCISVINMKCLWFRSIMDGNPSIVIRDGKIDIQELTKSRYNINELLEQLRVKGFANIADVEFAILETSGNLSVIPKSQKRPVTPEDLQIDTEYEGLPVPLIIDGRIQYDNLAEVNLTADWLKNELGKFNITEIKDVFLASLDTQGKLFFQIRKER
ncbi:MAG: DUF421 domain-containing protein [Firmicutes bacterium]|nr:DUF421 domain-containing protein [Bacillota bacterium]NLL87427.1 DUF421 domain-containing protein [Bacillota bacterium]